MNIFGKILFFIQRKIIPGFLVENNEIVIDVGSGDKPFWRADLFFDKLSTHNYHRATGSMITRDIGLFIDGDILRMPFKNKVFDFSYCSHVLEHVTNPQKAIREIMRISKRGYIEVPNGIGEMIKPFISHLWFIYLIDHTLIFVRKSKKLHTILSINNSQEQALIDKLHSPFIRYYWKDKIEFEILDDINDKDKYYPPKNTESYEKDNNDKYLLVIKCLRRLFFHKKNHLSKSFLFQ